MKSKLIQTCYALILPIVFIGILILLNIVPLMPLNKYGLGGLLVTFIALLLTFIVVKKDGKSFKDIGFFLERKTPVRLLTGFFIGFFIAVLMIVIAVSFSSLELIYNKESNIPSILLWLLAFFPLAYTEEIIFRGYAFIKIYNRIGIWPAQIIFAILFTWYHDFTGITFFNQLLGPGVWAFVYGIAAIWSKGIAFPTGLHMALNVVLALVGQKDNRFAIWSLDFSKEITPALKTQADNIGLVMQIVILLIAILLTEYYRRNKLKIERNSK